MKFCKRSEIFVSSTTAKFSLATLIFTMEQSNIWRSYENNFADLVDNKLSFSVNEFDKTSSFLVRTISLLLGMFINIWGCNWSSSWENENGRRERGLLTPLIRLGQTPPITGSKDISLWPWAIYFRVVPRAPEANLEGQLVRAGLCVCPESPGGIQENWSEKLVFYIKVREGCNFTGSALIEKWDLFFSSFLNRQFLRMFLVFSATRPSVRCRAIRQFSSRPQKPEAFFTKVLNSCRILKSTR